jgi:hypothetical protein
MDLLRSLKHKVELAQGFALLEWITLIEAWLRLFFFHLALLTMSYDRLVESTRLRDDEPEDSPSTLILAQRIQKLVGYAARLHLIPMTCLVKSLALQKMLGRRDVPSQIKIGVQKIQDTVFAHAWVEVNKKPIGEVADIAQKFYVLDFSPTLGNRQFI